MADDANVSRPPPNDPHVQPTPPTAPSHATTAPAAAPAARPRFSVVDAGKDLLRAALNLLIGAAVGGLAGLILNFTLLPLMGWTIDLRLVVGAGVLFGLFFNHAIVRLLRLTPRKEREAQAAA
ncbi:MAG TPA: hypothetical protein VMS17_15430, partial [Gemmataceae bacterium]|nr:hypothetical protein [Gemmataceae bacterium]